MINIKLRVESFKFCFDITTRQCELFWPTGLVAGGVKDVMSQ